MSLLSAHLRQPGGHAGLSFHPACPVCRRERVAGSLPADALMSARTQAVLAAGILAFSGVAAPAAVAADPDQTSEGTTAPDSAASDPALNPDFDPGGEPTDLPADAPLTTEQPAPPDPGSDDAAPLEPDPATDLDAPIVDAGDGADLPAPRPPAQSSQPAPVPTATPGPVTTPEATPTMPAPTAHAAPDDGTPVADTDTPPDEAGRQAPRDPEQRPSAGTRTRRVPSPEAVSRPAVTEPTTQTVTVAAAPPAISDPQAAPVRVEAGAAAGGARPGDRLHVVVAGESLWSIAADVVGHDASPAQIARQVNRLWALNAQRIATGDPDLILVGTRLRLR